MKALALIAAIRKRVVGKRKKKRLSPQEVIDVLSNDVEGFGGENAIICLAESSDVFFMKMQGNGASLIKMMCTNMKNSKDFEDVVRSSLFCYDKILKE